MRVSPLLIMIMMMMIISCLIEVAEMMCLYLGGGCWFWREGIRGGVLLVREETD